MILLSKAFRSSSWPLENLCRCRFLAVKKYALFYQRGGCHVLAGGEYDLYTEGTVKYQDIWQKSICRINFSVNGFFYSSLFAVRFCKAFQRKLCAQPESIGEILIFRQGFVCINLFKPCLEALFVLIGKLTFDFYHYYVYNYTKRKR